MKKPINILLITRYFPPLNSIATARMYSWAKYLVRKGCNVSVLTTTKQKQTDIPLELDTSAFNVCEVPYFDPIASLGIEKKRGADSFSAGKGFSAFGMSKIKQAVTNFYRGRMNERIPGRTDPWILPAYRELKRWAKKGITFDCVISSYGPPSAHIIGYFSKRLFNAYWVVDYRDLWLENSIYHGIKPFTALERLIEKKIIRHAELITTVSEPLQLVLEKKFSPIPVYVIENGFDPEFIDTVDGDYFHGQKKKFRIVYTGSLYWKNRNPTPLFQALRELLDEGKIQKDAVEVLFFGSYTGNLPGAIKSFRLEGVVSYLDAIGQQDSYRVQKSADALLFLESPEYQGILTGKLFEYLYVQAPILAIGILKDSSAGKIIEETNAGVVCESNVAKIKETLLTMMARNVPSQKKQELIMGYTREGQVDRLLELLA